MKKTLHYVVLVLLTLVLFSCKSVDKNTPEYVTASFVEAFYTGDFNTLYKCTPQSRHKIYEQLQRTMNRDKQHYEKIKETKVEILETQTVMVNDSVAECKCHFKKNDIEKEITYILNKKAEGWMVIDAM